MIPSWLAQWIRDRARWLSRLTRGALETCDLEAEGWLAALELLASREDAGERLVRRRVVGAMRDALRREWRACGRVRQTVRWPWFWPLPEVRIKRPLSNFRLRRCQECGTPELASNAKRCPPCATRHRLLEQRSFNRDYYQRRKAG